MRLKKQFLRSSGGGVGSSDTPSRLRPTALWHRAEGHFPSLRSPLDGLPVTDCEGADIGASESWSHPALLATALCCARTFATVARCLNVTLQCVASPREQASAVTMEIKTPAPSALAAVKAGPPAEPIDKTRRIPEKTRRAIELLATGKCKTQTEAAVAVGTTRETLCRNLAKPHILEFMRQRAMRTIAMAAGRAAEVKAELLDCADNMVRDRSSTFVLGVAGIAPATTPGLAVNIEIKAGYVIDLTDDPRPGTDVGMRIISPAAYSPAIDADLDQDSAE